MTVKEFFKSTAFKCIIVLLTILLVCGVFLTVMYGLLEVTEGERLQRAVASVYSGEEVKIYGLDDDGNEKEIGADEKSPKGMVPEKVVQNTSTVLQMYKITFPDSNRVDYLVQVTGNGGYSGGTVTCWVPVRMNDDCTAIASIGKVSIASNVGQSFIGKIKEEMLESYGPAYKDDMLYTPADGFVSAGASLSSTAIDNAVNGAIIYVKSAVLHIVSGEKFTDFYDPQSFINTDLSDYEVSDGAVKYTLVTKGTPESEDLKPGAFTLEITVKSDGGSAIIDNLSITQNGSTEDRYTNHMMPLYNLIGNGLEYFEGLLGTDWGYVTDGEIKTGATQSNYNVVYACAYAVKNYQNCIDRAGGENL